MKLKTIIMKKFLVLILLVANFAVFAQNNVETNQQQQPQTGPAPQKVVYVQKPAFTPHLRVNIYTLYAFDDKVDSRYSTNEYFYGTVEGGFQWGAGLEYLLIPNQGFEISYLRLNSNAPITYSFNYSNSEFTNFDLASNYIMIGTNRYLPLGKIEPYGGLYLGMGIFNVDNPENNYSENSTKFAWGAKVGLNLWATDMLGLKIQTGLNSAVQGAGGGLYFGTGGVGAGVNTYSTMFQFYVGGGLSLKMGK